MLASGTKKFTALLFKGTDGKTNAFTELEIFTTQDGTNWVSQGVLSTSYLNRESSAVVRFINPVEAKGIKIQALNPTRMGLFGIGELTFYAEN